MKKGTKICLCLILLISLWMLWGCAHFVRYRYPSFSSKEAKEHYIRGNRYFDSRRYDLAIPEFQIVADLEPQNAEGHVSLGVCYALTNRFNAAVNQYLQAIEIDSTKGEYHFVLSDAYYDLGLLDKCIEGYETGKRLSPSLKWSSQLVDLSRSRQEADKSLSTIETEHFQVKLDLAKDSTAVRELIPVLEQTYEQLQEELRFSPEKKTIIAFYPTEELYRMATPEKTWEEPFCLTHYSILLNGPAILNSSFSPEWYIAYAYAYFAAWNLGGLFCPVWLQQGIAYYESVSRFSEGLNLVRMNVRSSQKVVSLNELSHLWEEIRSRKRPFDEEKLDKLLLVWTHGFTVMEYIKDGYGNAKLWDLLNCLRLGIPEDESFQQALGVSLKQFEQGWREYVKRFY